MFFHLHELQLLFLSKECLAALAVRLAVKRRYLRVNNLGLAVPASCNRVSSVFVSIYEKRQVSGMERIVKVLSGTVGGRGPTA